MKLTVSFKELHDYILREEILAEDVQKISSDLGKLAKVPLLGPLEQVCGNEVPRREVVVKIDDERRLKGYEIIDYESGKSESMGEWNSKPRGECSHEREIGRKYLTLRQVGDL